MEFQIKTADFHRGTLTFVEGVSFSQGRECIEIRRGMIAKREFYLI
ncbi:MAG: hypothetical protein Q7U78_13260 [Gallionella sp.]|nr:hypothetical protein [Gallionella sp.]